MIRHFVMEPVGNTLLPTPPKGTSSDVVLSTDLSRFNEIDYDERSELISDELKLLMEMYLPRYDFKPVVYLDKEKDEQIVFWQFKPPVYEDFHAMFRSDGIVSSITFENTNAPIVFTVRSPKGKRSIVVRIAVAESALRRGILGVKFTTVTAE